MMEAKVEAKVGPKVVHATCVVERSVAKPSGVVFAALSNPDKIRQWMGGGEHSDLLEFDSEFREGGKQILKYKMRPGTPIAGAVITNEVRFQHIVPGERIVTASTMRMDDRIFSASQVTFELVPSEAGTDVIITHQGAFFEGSDGPAMREQGWIALADKLAAVVNEQ
ncbi:MAG TPA: SRPBCC domain-containing protein [Terracidiphilus sp.]|jgi:uncharacterized protein YndB with AHSA1/START domain|nr:SRPBCC domain-containing protein [Terracidiphilus sp.]